MKRMKKLASFVLAMVMIMTMTMSAFAQTVAGSSADNATITISNAAKGETYSIYKLFDASVTGNEGGSIAYTGTIPESLTDYFEMNSVGNISAKDAAKTEYGDMSDGLKTALTAWVKSDDVKNNPTATAVSDGSELKFTGLDYGYYVITTSQGTGVITVHSTNPNATVYDKNIEEPAVTKSVDDADVYIGQTVTYTVKAVTANYNNDKQIKSYDIIDTLPDFLTNVTVTSITIDQDGDGNPETGVDSIVNLAVQQFGDDKTINIPWVDEEGNSLYANGSIIIITYTATVTDKAKIDGTEGNVNTVTLEPNDADGENPWDKEFKDDEKIFTYATALQKVDENKKPLAGAKFTIAGLEAEKTADGVYTVTKYDPETVTNPTLLECDAQGQLVILGINSDFETDEYLEATETEAPAGYNKLVETVKIKPQKTGEEIVATEKTIYYDGNGNVTEEETSISYEKTTYNIELLKKAIVVVNQKGSSLPETGGMGTTIFYLVGGVLVFGAAVIMITRKRMSNEE